ncbi:Hcp family type VI secretion system effector [Erwiniaceae bacterium CAU 1747]
MGNAIYLTLNGSKQGLISAGCLSYESVGNKAQPAHRDQILILSTSRSITRGQHVNHQPVIVTKPIDKSSPLLGLAIDSGELLNVQLDYYRTSAEGMQQHYYTVKLIDAVLIELTEKNHHSINHTGSQPEEILQFRYGTTSWQHLIAGTSGYSVWHDRVY